VDGSAAKKPAGGGGPARNIHNALSAAGIVATAVGWRQTPSADIRAIALYEWEAVRYRCGTLFAPAMAPPAKPVSS